MKRCFATLMAVILIVCMIPAASVAAQYATVVGGWLRLRSEPNFNAYTITSYYTGSQVEILGSTGSWYRVRTSDGIYGYMYSQYLRLGSSTGSSGSADAYVISYNGYGVRLRKGPGTGYRIINTYAVGTPVTVLERGSYWSRVKINGVVGYMMTQFLNFGSNGNSSYDDDSVVCYANIWSSNGYGVRLRTGPGKGYSKIGVYSVGTTVAVLQKGEVWDRIRVGSRVGWMMNEFLDYHSSKEVTSVTLNTLSPVVGTVMSVQAITPSKATVTYEWRVDGQTLGTDATYTVTAADVGKAIQLKVKGTGKYEGSAKSAVTNKVLSSTQLLGVTLNTTAPVAGNKLKATVSPSDAKVTYAWKINGVQVGDGSTYTVTSADVGSQIQLVVTGKDGFSGSVYATTAEVKASAMLTDVTVGNQTNPTPGAAPAVGDTLIAKPAPEQATVTYQWKRDNAAITDATLSTYTLTENDLGKAITVTIVGRDAYTGTKTSAATEKVAAKPTAPVVDDIALPNGKVEKTYAARLTAQGGGVITWKLSSGSSLPAGLQLAEDGAITGTPTTAGTMTFGVLASNNAGTSAEKKFSITIDEKDSTTYTLTVNGGTGSKNGLTGDEIVEISATVPAGQQFTGWTLDTGSGNFYKSSEATTTFTMNGSDATITAHFEAISETPKTYTLTVNGGTGSRNDLAGNAVVEISATVPSGQQFAGWTVDTGAGNFQSSSSATTTFTMDNSDATITAHFKTVSEDTDTYSLMVNGGTGSKSDLAGDAIVEISATVPAGQQFTGWTLDAGAGNFQSSSTATTTFTMNNSDATITAHFENIPAAVETYDLTVNGGTGSTNDLEGNAVVEISATVPAGQQFTGWTLDSGKGNFYSSSSATTSFEMNHSDATVTAHFEPIPEVVETYTLTVNGGSGSKNGLEGKAVVDISATVPAGQQFTGWTLDSGKGNFYSSREATTKFKMNGSDATVTAHFEPIPAVAETYTLTVNGGSGSKSGLEGNAIVNISATVPEGQKFTGWTLDSGSGNFYSSITADTTFTMNGSHATVTAHFEPVSVDAEP